MEGGYRKGFVIVVHPLDGFQDKGLAVYGIDDIDIVVVSVFDVEDCFAAAAFLEDQLVIFSGEEPIADKVIEPFGHNPEGPGGHSVGFIPIGEEDELATRRATLMNAEKNTEILSDAINALCPNGESLDSRVFSVAHILQRCRGDTNPYQEQIDALYDVGQRLSEISEQLTPADTDTDDLESVEERLFAIRAVARKHRVSADELPAKLEQMSAQLNAIENSDAELHKLQNATETARANFMHLAKKLSELRARAGTDLRTQILSELPELKLASADFMVEQTDGTPSRTGCDDITFMIKTNPGMPFAPLHKSASGGELSRLMLAMRVVLADSDNAHTFVFDEIDTGISGATASAVGSRLARLSATSQALVITHSAQVAGYADKHFKISKNSDGNTTTTTVSEISGDEHINEIARIISGAEITPESLATARTLIKQ